jgi:hypothetical protein
MHQTATCSTWSCFASMHPSRLCHVSSSFPGNRTVEFWCPNSAKPTIRSAWWFWGSTTKPLWVAYCIRVPHVLDMCPISPWTCWQHDLLQHEDDSACPWCQPPRLVTRLLWSLGQVPALILHRSQPIGTNPHDLHICRRPPSLCSIPAHHKPRDVVA